MAKFTQNSCSVDLTELDLLPQQWQEALLPIGFDKAPRHPKTQILIEDWTTLPPFSREELKGARAVGLRLGPPSGGTMTTDFDSADGDPEGAERLFQECFGRPSSELPKTIGFASGRPGRRQLAFRVPPERWPELKRRKATFVNAEVAPGSKLEFRWEGQQSVLLGAHPEPGCFYRWIPGGSPAEVDLAEAPKWLLDGIPKKQEKPLAQPSAAAAANGAATPDPALPGLQVPLTDFISKEHKLLLERGSEPGSNNDEQLQLTLDLVGAELWLNARGVECDSSAAELFDGYLDRCEALWQKAGKDPTKYNREAALNRLQGAYDREPEPSTPAETLEKRINYHKNEREQKNADERLMQRRNFDSARADKKLTLRADERPIDVQAVEHLLGVYQNRLACVGSTLFVYSHGTGIWQSMPDAEMKRIIRELLLRYWRMSKNNKQHFCFGGADHIKKTLESLKIAASAGPLKRDRPPSAIVFEDGTFDLLSSTFGDHSPKYGATYRIKAPFVQDADCPDEVWRVINTCLPDGAEVVVRALVRWVVDPTIRYGQAFHFLGDSGTGKGLMLELISALLPPECQSSLAHPGILDSPEKLHQHVLGKRLILFPDTPARPSNAKHC
jgi:hypothetical protein